MHFSIQHNSTLNSNYVSKLHTQWYQTAKKQKKTLKVHVSPRIEKKLISSLPQTGWTSNKQTIVPYLQPNGQVMINLKLWFESDLLKVTNV